MSLRTLLKATLAAAVLTISQQSYAQESREKPRQQKQQNQTITVNRKRYHITPDKVILDEKEERVTNQNILKKVILTHLINKKLRNYQTVAEQNLRKLNSSRTATQFSELKKKYKTVLRTPIKHIIKDLRNPKPMSIFRRLNIGRSLYRGTREALTSIYLDPKMYLYSDITANLTQAQKDYKEFISLSQNLTDYTRATKALDLLVESEYIIRASTYSFREINRARNPKLRIYDPEKEKFNTLLDLKDTGEIIRARQKLCDSIRSRARKTKEAKNYVNLLNQNKKRWYSFKQKLRTSASIMFHSNQ